MSGGTAPTTWTNAGNVTTVTISSLTKGTAYTFNVRAVNAVGAGPHATVDETPSGKPGPVRNLTATGRAGSIMLDWDEPADNGGSAIARYEVQKYNAATTNWGPAYSGPDTSLHRSQRHRRRHDRVPCPCLQRQRQRPQ